MSSPALTDVCADESTGPLSYLTTSWTTEQGLPQNSVRAIAQTHDGYLWIGTDNGIVRFDGLTFTPPPLRTLAHAGIRMLKVSGDGTLWIGTATLGLCRLTQGVVQAYPFGDGSQYPDVVALAPAPDGSVWVATHRGAVMQFRDGRFSTRFRVDDALTRFETPLEIDRAGAIWLGTPRGLVRFRGGERTTFTTKEGLPDAAVTGLFLDKDGSLLIATARGLARFADDRIVPGPALSVSTRPAATAPARPVTALRDTHGLLWVGTSAGLYRLGPGPPVHVADVPDELVSAIVEDREGHLWASTSASGLVRLRRPRLQHYAAGAGLPAAAKVVTEDRQGRLLTAQNGRVMVRDGDTFRDLAAINQLLPARSIHTVRETRDGVLWVGFEEGGLVRIEHGQATRYTTANSALPHDTVRALYEDRRGRLLVGTFGGAAIVDRGRLSALSIGKLGAAEVVVFLEDRRGTLWIGTQKGLIAWKEGGATRFTTAQGLPDDFVRSAYEDRDGVLWFGTYGGGLVRLKDDRFATIDAAHGLHADVIHWMAEDREGRLWMSSNRGIFWVRRAELNDVADGVRRAVASTAYGESDGMVTSEGMGGVQPAGWQAADGTLWFPMLRGLVAIDPAVLNPRPPSVTIEQVIANDRPLPPGVPAQVPAGDGRLEVRYTAASLGTPKKAQFEFRLDGYDRDWVVAGTRRTAFYTNLPPGAYTFRVRARNEDGILNERGTAMSLTLSPRFTQTLTFRLLAAAALLAAGFAAFRWRTRQLVRRTRELEERVAARTAEVLRQAQELEDANARLAVANRELLQARDSLLDCLNQLHLGVMMVDEDENVRYASDAALELLQREPAAIVGRPWSDCLPLSDEDGAHVRQLFAVPDPTTRLPVRMEVGGRQYWMEISLQREPAPGTGRFLYLYDVTETYNLRTAVRHDRRFQELVGDSAAMHAVYRRIDEVAGTDVTILIEGETGTGKELVARAVHRLSRRRDRPFVPVNVAGLSESLLSSQLFGHRRGSFTGAVNDSVGLLEAANGGTLFLDEVGDMPASVQTSLLRVLQEREILRLGESMPRKIDVRILAATHQNLAQLVAAGLFRQDLLYRIRVATIRLPALRERRGDVPLLVGQFLPEANTAAMKSVGEVSSSAMIMLTNYPWPGNVRELRSAVAEGVLRADGPVIQVDDLPAEIRAFTAQADRPRPNLREELADALRQAGGNRAEAARRLGISRATLYRRLASLGFLPEE